MAPQHTDVYSIVTDRIIQQLQHNTVPWQKPWTTAGYPCNFITKIPYRGINVFMLASLGYTQNYFLTWKQLKALGGTLKKGEKGHLVVFWLPVSKQEEEETDTPAVPILRYYLVFNIDQCQGIPEVVDIPRSPYDISSIGTCDEIIERYVTCPPIKHSKHAAFYDKALDYINMPKQKSFTSTESYYSTLFHELVHSSGHEDRLNRKGIVDEDAAFGTDMYSQEELVAEIGACYLNSIAGIVDVIFDNSVAYITSWIQRLQNDPRMIVFASIQAQKAVEYILNVKPYEKPDLVQAEITFQTH